MRIAVFIKSTTLHKHYGGLETQNKTLVEGLVQSGHEVVVYSPAEEIKDFHQMQNNVRYIFVPVKYKNAGFFESLLNPKVKEGWYEASLKAFLQEHHVRKFDVAVSQSSAGLGIIRNKKHLGIKVLSICHGTILSEFKTLLSRPQTPKSLLRLVKDFEYTIRVYLTRQREFILHSDKVVAVSYFVCRNVLAETGLAKEKISVIYNGISDPHIDLTKREAQPLGLLYVGRVEADKGLFELLDIFARNEGWKKLGVRLTVVGDGSDLLKLKKQSQILEVEDRVEFTGWLKDSKFKYFESSHIFVFPTKRIEGFPVTIPEALYCGLPIVAFKLGGISEGINEGKTGLLVESGAWDVYRDTLNKLIIDPKLRHSMSIQALESAKNNYSLSKMVSEYLAILNTL